MPLSRWQRTVTPPYLADNALYFAPENSSWSPEYARTREMIEAQLLSWCSSRDGWLRSGCWECCEANLDEFHYRIETLSRTRHAKRKIVTRDVVSHVKRLSRSCVCLSKNFMKKIWRARVYIPTNRRSINFPSDIFMKGIIRSQATP